MYEKKLESNIRRHLSLTQDPYHIAQSVAGMLEKGRFDEALMMARMSSRNTKVEVSWNHLIDHQMKNHRLHAAVKLYNEMKKRAQIPNAKTYTIIFRGCAQSIHPKLAVAEATRIYNFMIKAGPLKPNTIHMNAVLEVCARAGDLESLFTILVTSNASMRSPDAHTFTIVLNALRYDSGHADRSNIGLIDAEVKREIQKNLLRARAIWTDVIANWKSAKIIIDEHLVFAMGRLLAMGDYKDNDSVLDLLEQTMKIPRLDKPNVKLPDAPPAETDAAADPSMPENETADTTNMSPKDRKAFVGLRANKTPLYARPGNKTLSLVLTVLVNTRKTSSAVKYWNYLTKIAKVTPDDSNHAWYLRALASGHASAQVASVIAEMPPTLLTPLTFRRGFSACIGDNLNPQAFKNACRIFDVMATKQRYADALAMRLFLQVARANTRHFHDAPPPTTPNETAAAASAAGKLAHGTQILAALDRMWEPFRILTGSLSYPAEATRSPEEERERQRGALQEIMATARRMIAAIDRVAGAEDGMMQLVAAADRRAAKLWHARRIVLQRLVERHVRILYPDGPPPEEVRERRTVLEEVEGLAEERTARQAARHASF
ncbi:hypothetical protein CHGG_05569 [Chaetomium globosum CBS 148.51]|uniref:Pentatricopeptide repeat protein n=1 Tax=Chaetomium globosum (strain ATCC 6205 / CBS 148.51 / DSM 1962 / NBRC 6347 / NRRL 1970) TaxID=306901 RepID=Q2H6Z6_CHAGB|nr:uncharacterized protein CHGG_05569 [Chaetomium globosum CBS 148.51]EAQ88950.1 hypothetical protein CHGG_05569 [Chaetomium globosum CBS 148.51]